jgi:hypothetical protein
MALGDWYLNGTKLCPWNFAYRESYDIVGEDVRVLSGLMRRDIVARKLMVEMSWGFLPETFDGTYHCYNDLRALGTNTGTMKLIRPIGTSTGTEQFFVFCDVPEGEVAHRTDSVDVYWNCGFRVIEA